MNLRPAAALPFFALLAGCSTTPPEKTFGDASADLERRAGAAPVVPLDDDAQRRNDAAVKALLDSGVDASVAVKVALANNRHVRETMDSLGVSRAEADAAGFLPNPTLAGSARWPHTAPRGPNVEFDLAFNLLDALLIPLKTRIAENNFEHAKAKVGHELLETVARTRDAYYAYRAAIARREAVAFMAKLNDASLVFARRRYDAGNINRLELEQFAAAKARTDIDVIRAGRDERVARETLNRELGLSGAAARDWKPADEPATLPDADPALDDLENVAVAGRLDLAAARTDLCAAERILNLKTDTRFLPGGVSVGVSTEREPAGDRVTGPTFSLDVPIFDQGQAEIARLESVVRMLKDKVAALENDVRTEVRVAREKLVAARAAATAFRDELLPARKRVTREMLLQYNAMNESAFELIQARTQEQEAMLENVDALLDYRLARVELDRAVGARLPETVSKPAAPEKKTPEPDMPAMPEGHMHHHQQ